MFSNLKYINTAALSHSISAKKAGTACWRPLYSALTPGIWRLALKHCKDPGLGRRSTWEQWARTWENYSNCKPYTHVHHMRIPTPFKNELRLISFHRNIDQMSGNPCLNVESVKKIRYLHEFDRYVYLMNSFFDARLMRCVASTNAQYGVIHLKAHTIATHLLSIPFLQFEFLSLPFMLRTTQ